MHGTLVDEKTSEPKHKPSNNSSKVKEKIRKLRQEKCATGFKLNEERKKKNVQKKNRKMSE